MKRLTVTAATGGLLCALMAGCAPPTADEMPAPTSTFSEVPTTSPTPSPGKDVPLASTTTQGVGYPVYMDVWDVEAWKSQGGCGCSAPGETAELYPAGAVAWTIRVDLRSDRNWSSDEGLDASQMALTPSWGPGAPVPVEVQEGATRAATGPTIGWGFRSALTPPLFPWGETRSFLMSVYVPRGAVSLTLQLEVPSKGSNGAQNKSVSSLDVPVPQPVIELMYAANPGD